MSVTRPFRALTAAVAIVSALLLPGLARADNDLPRYDLAVGRRLSYSSESQSKQADGGAGSDTRARGIATVVAPNADGSRRVVLRNAYTYAGGPERVTVGAVDVFPDGRTKPVGRP